MTPRQLPAIVACHRSVLALLALVVAGSPAFGQSTTLPDRLERYFTSATPQLADFADLRLPDQPR